MDSGTTLLRLPQKVFNAVVEAVARTSLVSPQDAESWRTASPDHTLGSVTMYYPNSLHLTIGVFFKQLLIKFTVLFFDINQQIILSL